MNKKSVFNFIIVFFLIMFVLVWFVSAAFDSINLISPSDNNWTNGTNNTITFTFNYTGNVSNSSCTLYIDGSAYGTNSTVLNNTNTIIYANNTITEGSHFWNVTCNDTFEIKNSSTYNLIVDRTVPKVNISTPWGIISSNNTYPISFNYIDELSLNASCTLYFNDTFNDAAYGTNSTTLNNTNTTIIPNSSLSDGGFFFYVNCTDLAGNVNKSENNFIIIDTTIPNITIDNLNNNTIFDKNNNSYHNITGNFSDVVVGGTIFISNITFYLNGVFQGLINDSHNGSLDRSTGLWWYNWSFLDGEYNLTFEICDYVDYCANASVYNITIDQEAPVITSISTSSVGTSSAILNVETDETAVCKYASSDLNYTNMTNTFTNTNSTTHNTTLSGLSASTSYTYYVRCNDGAGNVMNYSNSTTFTTDSESNGDDDDDSSSISTNVDRTIGKLIYNRSFTLKLNDYRKFSINGLYHKITLKKLTNISAVFRIESDPRNLTLEEGETGHIDVDDNGEKDTFLRLDKIYFNSLSAYITIGPYNETEEIAEEENLTQPEENLTGAIGEGINITKGENESLNITGAEGESESSNKWLVTFVVIIILIVAGIVSMNVIHIIKERKK
ncbi:hypothetical protein JW949_02580 [Candidatus Woesearchaeota archaeon]|nr:hypothetical protein [Candidatus Woesearchaeota archaeon]